MASGSVQLTDEAKCLTEALSYREVCARGPLRATVVCFVNQGKGTPELHFSCCFKNSPLTSKLKARTRVCCQIQHKDTKRGIHVPDLRCFLTLKKLHYCQKCDLILLTPSKSRKAGLHPGLEEVPIPLGPSVLAPFMPQLTCACAGMHCWDPSLSAPWIQPVPKAHAGFCKNSCCAFVKERYTEHKSFSIFPLHHLAPFPISFGKWNLT